MARPLGALCERPCPSSARAHAWALIRKCGKSRDFSLDELLACAPEERCRDRTGLRKWLTALRKDGIVKVTETKNGHPHRYLLVRNLGQIAPILRADGGLTNPNKARRAKRSRGRSTRSSVWALLRNFGVRRAAFGFGDIEERLGAISSDQQRYVRALAASGHLKTCGRGRWRMARDTGPDAPVMRECGAIYDPNTGGLHERS